MRIGRTPTLRLVRLGLFCCLFIIEPVVVPGVPTAVAQSPQVLPEIVVQGAALETPAPVPKTPSGTARPAPAAASAAAADAGVGQPAAEGGGETAEATGEGGIPVERIGTSVSVVTGEDLRQQQIRHAADALRSLPGVAVSRTGSPAGLTQVRLRGAEANQTLVLIDGIEANAGTDGAFDFSDLLTEDIERIEVIRGPQSALYGANALGGVINIVTRGGKGPMTVTTRAEAGTFGTREGAVRIAGGNARAWGALTVQGLQSDGFNIAPHGALGEEDASRLASISARAGAMLADNVRLDLTVRNTNKKGDRDDQTGLDSRGGFVIASDSLSYFDSSVLLMGAQLRWDSLGGDLTQTLKASRNVTRRDDVGIVDFGFGFGPPSLFDNTSEADKIAYQATYRLAAPWLIGRHVLTGLVERERESFTSNSTFGGRVGAGRSQTGAAAEWRAEFLNRLFLTAGVRHDVNDTFEDFTTWRATASLPLRELGLRPHASAGTGVKAPTLFEQFGSTANFVSNPGLKPEESLGWDAGVELTFLGGRAMVDVTYFAADLRNKIRTEFVSAADPGRIVDCKPGDLFCSYPVNLDGAAQRRGVEVSSRFEIMPGLGVGLAYTYLDAVERNGEREIRRPPHSGRADVSYAFDGGRGLLRLAAVYNGEADDEVFGAPFFFPVQRLALDDYWLVTAAASYKLQPGVEIYGRIENLLDERYEEIFGFNTAGIAGYAGVRLTFGGDGPPSRGMK